MWNSESLEADAFAASVCFEKWLSSSAIDTYLLGMLDRDTNRDVRRFRLFLFHHVSGRWRWCFSCGVYVCEFKDGLIPPQDLSVLILRGIGILNLSSVAS